MIDIDHELSDRIKEEQLKVDALLKDRGIEKISEKAYRLLVDGVTSLEEVYALLTNI